MNAKYLFSLLIIYSMIFSSCVSTKGVTSFNSISDTTIHYAIENLEPVIQKNDILSITVSSINSDATQPFNLYTISSSQGTVNSGTVSQASGYLVNQEGYIQFPMLGNIKAEGVTKRSLTDTIAARLIRKNLLYEPIVNIRYLNYKITVLGEVARPAVINVPGEKITLLEALGISGDLTSFANRSNVLVIRDTEKGKRTTKRLDLTDEDILSSPYYFLKSNDIVYVAPNKAKAASTSTSRQLWPIVLSAMSFVAVIIGIVSNR